MIAIRIEIKSYDKETNTCEAKLLNGDIISLDPFVACSVSLSDEDYSAGLGNKIVGKRYILIEYTVYKENVVPHEGGMIEL